MNTLSLARQSASHYNATCTALTVTAPFMPQHAVSTAATQHTVASCLWLYHHGINIPATCSDRHLYGRITQ